MSDGIALCDRLVLESERLILRPLTLDDDDLAIHTICDPQVMRYVTEVCSMDDLPQTMQQVVTRGAGGRIGVWCATRKGTGEKIGTGALLPLPVKQEDTDWSLLVSHKYPDAEIEIGYILKRAAWGKGFATEICSRMLQFAFEETSLGAVAAITDPDNSASRHVLMKSGFRDVGNRQAYAATCPSYRITREQWRDKIRSPARQTRTDQHRR